MIPVDGEPTTFATFTDDGHFAAAARVGELVVTITGPPPGEQIELRSIAPDTL